MRENSSKESIEKARRSSDAVMRVTYSLSRALEDLEAPLEVTGPDMSQRWATSARNRFASDSSAPGDDRE
jgi:hypothetical protein